jgi:DNA-binding XRE family transcriptional regulator
MYDFLWKKYQVNIFTHIRQIRGMDSTKKSKEIGTKLRKLRIEAGYTSYEKFAIDNELNRQTVYRAEKGEGINIKTLIVILTALKIKSLGEFFKDL